MTRRTMIVLGLAAAVLSGCAQPGQLGSPEPPPPLPPVAAPLAPAPPPAPVPPAGPVLLGTGRIEDPITLRTPGPAQFSVRTIVVPPGGTTGWHQHPGTEMSLVTSGVVTLVRRGACEPVEIGPGQAVFIPDGLPHLARNDGTVPAELVVTYLLAPGAEDRSTVPPAC